MIRPMPHIGAMSAYALSQNSVPSGVDPVQLSQNECLRAPSPAVFAAAMQAMAEGHLYPDPDWTGLREALADLHGIPLSGILCGSGSLELIGCLANCFAGPGRSVLAPAHAYPFFRAATGICGARFDTAPETDLTVDVDALLAAQRPDTSLVFVANPGNPTGTRLPRSELVRLRDGLRADILLVIDEAYGEFADHLSEPVFDFVPAGNTAVLRTLSKAYGMAGFRVGWGLFPKEVAAELRKTLNPNNMSAPSQAAATEAVRDQTYMRNTCQMTAQLRGEAIRSLRAAGLAVPDSLTNFVTLDLKTPQRVEQADAFLQNLGVVLRRQGGAGLPHVLRLTIGGFDETRLAVDHLIRWHNAHPTEEAFP